MAWSTGWTTGWTGASGQLVGFAGDLPVTTGQGFTADEVHGQAYNPNGHNLNAQPGETYDVPVEIQGHGDWGLWDGADGWLLDSLPFPTAQSTNAGTEGHDASLDSARAKRRDPGHSVDVYQDNVPTGHGVDFYGTTIETGDYALWTTPGAPGSNTKSFPAQARADRSNWPEPFAALTVAPMAPVVIDTEKIPMRRINEDDRPIYSMLAVPAQNVQPGSSQWLPTVPSNTVLRNLIPTPQMARTPVDPWVSEQDDSAYASPDDQDVFGGDLG